MVPLPHPLQPPIFDAIRKTKYKYCPDDESKLGSETFWNQTEKRDQQICPLSTPQLDNPCG